MRLAVLALATLAASPVMAQSKDELTLVYAYVVGTAPNCNVPIDMVKAGQYHTDFGLDAEAVGKQMWEAAQLVSQLDGQALADYCGTIADSVEELGLKP